MVLHIPHSQSDKLKKTDLFEALESDAAYEYCIGCMIYSIKATLVLRQEPVS